MTALRPPHRTCIGCRRTRRQTELRRVAIGADGRIVMSRVAAGRGAWLCDPPTACLTTAIRRNAFGRAFRRPVTTEMIEQLRTDLERETQMAARTTHAAHAASVAGERSN